MFEKLFFTEFKVNLISPLAILILNRFDIIETGNLFSELHFMTEWY